MKNRKLWFAMSAMGLSVVPHVAQAQTVEQGAAAQVLDPFSQLNNTPEGRAQLAANLQTVVSINANSTASERAVALVDNTLVSNGTKAAEGLGETLNRAYNALTAANNPAFSATSGAFGIALRDYISLTLSDAIIAKNIYANANGSSSANLAPPPLVNFTFPAGGTTNTYGQAYTTLPTATPNPYGNPRPYQVAAMAYVNSAQGGSNNTSSSFPSGHAALGTAQSLLLAMMVPERYQEMLTRGSQDGYSRLVLGVHYPLDVIGGRILATYAIAQMLNGDSNYENQPISATPTSPATTSAADSAASFAAGMAALRTALSVQCGASIAQCADQGADPFADHAQNKATYESRLTYGLPSVGATNLAPVVPVGAEVLLSTRFPYLSAQQRRDVLATTELPSGVPLDDGSGWARLNLFAAADGYGSLPGAVVVTMNAALGSFNAFDEWRNDIGGTGSLTKAGTGTLALSGTNSWTGATTITGGTLLLVDQNNLPATTTLTNNAVLSMADGAVTGRATVANYAGGPGSLLVLDASASAADRLRITGSVAAGSRTSIVVMPAGSAAYDPNGVILVDGTGATGLSDTSFVLANSQDGSIYRGLYSQSLSLQNQQLRLISLPNVQAFNAASIAEGGFNMSFAATQEWLAHVTQQRGSLSGVNLWIQPFVRNSNGGRGATAYQQTPTGLAGGFDAPLATDGLSFSAMILGGHGDQRFDATGNRAKIGTIGVSASLSYSAPSGLFLDAGFRYDSTRSKYSAAGLAAFGQSTAQTTIRTTSAIVSAGYTFTSGRVFIEPSATVMMSWRSMGDLTLGTSTVRLLDEDQLTGRLGLRAGANLTPTVWASINGDYWNHLSGRSVISITEQGGAGLLLDAEDQDDLGSASATLGWRSQDKVWSISVTGGAQFREQHTGPFGRLSVSRTF